MAQVIKGTFSTTKPSQPKEDKPVPSYILHISITFSDPLIWRLIQIPGTCTLADLHDVIQRSMGWSDSHIHQFIVGKISYEPTIRSNTPRISKRFDEDKYQLHTLEEGMRFMFSYIYDAGGGWEHEIHLSEVVPATKPISHPIVLAGERACPPEDVVDIHEYHQLITAFETPGSKDYHRLYEMTGRPDFDPAVFDLESAKKRLAEL
ncbi:plasmid pRiA4b ORF-3 family protein [Desulforhopalus sp. IMCC35007]|uniref:plasmid pRiA4b ORF-3 family protein n=1 Tax=Desulforhopalus sp. IMCC35007 TaxID=2569543 RepID=UPI0010AE4518|nr:plasmid pRiA4b ORF-3 family protein [Desulforhopalus sp. IMCC35007]TKB05879.1 plasmid pRiA4b ORF-3 family protein [Desulforhopalus sp. IMCC35007]